MAKNIKILEKKELRKSENESLNELIKIIFINLGKKTLSQGQVKVSNQFFELISIFFGIFTLLRIVFYILLKKR